MPPRRILHLTCLLITSLCLAFGQAKIGLGMTITSGLVSLGVWLLAYKWPTSWLPSMALVITVCLAVIGLSMGATALPMLAAATLALANWDLAWVGSLQAGSASPGKISLLDKKHYQSLLLVLGLAFPAILIGRIIHIHVPFILMMLLVISAFFCLTRVSPLFSE